MSFHQNPANQWAPQEQSEPEANSSPAPRWTGAPTYAQSVDNDSSFDEEMESNATYFDDVTYYNDDDSDDNSDLPDQGFVSSFSDEEPSHEVESNPIEERELRLRNYLPDLNLSADANQLIKYNLIQSLYISIEELSRRFLSGPQTPAIQGKKLRAALNALEIVVRYLAWELPKHSYGRNFNRKLETFAQDIIASTSFILENILQCEKDAPDFEATVASIGQNLEVLKAWNKKQSFLCGQSEKFANVVCAKDLLPQNDGPTTCGICFSTVEETSDFAVQSECTHIFCTPCISAWFETKANCPMCRQGGLFMSKDRLLELRSSGPEPAR